MRRTLDRLYATFGAIAALFVLAILVLMVVGSIGRVWGWKVSGINDLVAWCCAAASFFAMAQAFKQGDFVRVTLLLDGMPPRLRRAFEIGSLSVALVAVGYLAFWAARFTVESYTLHEIASGLVAIPIWIPQSSFVLGALLFLVAVADELVIVLGGGRPSYVLAVEERHAKGDFSGDV